MSTPPANTPHGMWHTLPFCLFTSGLPRRKALLNEVDARRARLQLGWVTVFGRVYHLGL